MFSFKMPWISGFPSCYRVGIPPPPRQESCISWTKICGKAKGLVRYVQDFTFWEAERFAGGRGLLEGGMDEREK